MQKLGGTIRKNKNIGIPTRKPLTSGVPTGISLNIMYKGKLYNTSIYEVRIKFYGNYNNAIAVVVSSSDFGGATVITTITVEGVDFIYPDSATEVLIWKR